MVSSSDFLVGVACGLGLAQAFSSRRLGEFVEIDSVRLAPRHLQNRQNSVDHLRRTARIAVDLAGQLLFPKMSAHGFVDETGLSLPLVGGLRVRQRRNESEVGKLAGDGRQLVQQEQVRARTCSIEETNGPLFAALDMIGENRPQRRHAGAPADQNHGAGTLLSTEARAVWPLGDKLVAGLQFAVE